MKVKTTIKLKKKKTKIPKIYTYIYGDKNQGTDLYLSLRILKKNILALKYFVYQFLFLFFIL